MSSESNFLKRVLTAVIGIAIILFLVIFGGEWGITLLAFVCAVASLFEFFLILFPAREEWLQRGSGILSGAFLLFFIIFRSQYLYEGISLVFLFLFILYLCLSHLYQGNHARFLSALSFSILGIFYIGFLFSFWPKVRELSDGVYWIFLVFLIPWLSDTAAYFVGKSFGKNKLSEAISPGKTREGAFAGLTAATLGVLGYQFLIFKEITVLDSILLGVIGSCLSQAGDLFESFIKRSLAVKDSGVLIPGHGGILDRFDGVLFCGPFIYFYAVLT